MSSYLPGARTRCVIGALHKFSSIRPFPPPVFHPYGPKTNISRHETTSAPSWRYGPNTCRFPAESGKNSKIVTRITRWHASWIPKYCISKISNYRVRRGFKHVFPWTTDVPRLRETWLCCSVRRTILCAHNVKGGTKKRNEFWLKKKNVVNLSIVNKRVLCGIFRFQIKLRAESYGRYIHRIYWAIIKLIRRISFVKYKLRTEKLREIFTLVFAIRR